MYPEFAYPLRHEIVPIWLAALLASLIPIIIIFFMQIRIRSFWDINNAIIGLLYSLITAAVFQVFLKWLIDGTRPHFLGGSAIYFECVFQLTAVDVCKPAVPAAGTSTGNGLAGIMYDRKICMGDRNEINDSLESFPSGHITAAFGGFVFLYLYLNAKLKVWSNYHPAYFKLIVTYMPILGATLIGGALTTNEYHDWWDVVAAAITGTVMAFSAYRMVYASVWDFRFSHVPLMRHIPFTYGDGPAGFHGFCDALRTRQAGWGANEVGAWGGAPFDGWHGACGSGGVAAEGTSIDGAGAVGRRSSDPHSGRRIFSRRTVDGINERGSDGLGLTMGGWEAAAFLLGIWNVVEPW